LLRRVQRAIAYLAGAFSGQRMVAECVQRV